MKTENIMDTYLNNRIRTMDNLIKDMNIDLKQEMIFLIGEGLDFNFNVVSYPLLKSIKLWYADGFNRNFEKNIFDKLQIKNQEFSAGSSEELIKIIEHNLKDGNTVICRIDDELLKNYKSVTDKKIPAVRCLTDVKINSIDIENGSIDIDYEGNNVEGIINENLRLTLDKFLLSAFSNVMPSAPEGSGYIVDTKNFNLKVDIESILKNSILSICENMTSNIDSSGLNSIRQLLKELDIFKKSINEAAVDNEIIDKLFNIKFKILRKTLLYGSNSLYRSEFAYSLKNANKIIDNKEIGIISDKFLQLGSNWLNFSRIISISNFRTKDKNEFINKLYTELDNMCNQEEKLFTNLKSCIR